MTPPLSTVAGSIVASGRLRLSCWLGRNAEIIEKVKLFFNYSDNIFIRDTIISNRIDKADFMMKYRNQWLEIVIGATALYLGGPAMQHWLAYYCYPYSRCITLFEQNPDNNKTKDSN